MPCYIWHQSLEAHVLGELVSTPRFMSELLTLTPAIFSVLLKYSLAPEIQCLAAVLERMRFHRRSAPRFPAS